MDSVFSTFLILVIALLAGVGLGWLFGSRPAADLRVRLNTSETDGKDQETQFRKAIAELGEAQIELATLKANAANFEQQKAGLLTAQESLKAEFEAAGAKILARAQDALLNRAQERFTQSEEKNEARIKALLEPVGQRLASYEVQVGKLEKERVDAFGQLGGLIQSLRDGQEQVRKEALRLGESLRNAPKVRGRWGEMSLKNILEQCGLSKYADFKTEVSVEGEEGRLRPDVIVSIPGQKSLIIDAKVSLIAYQESFDAEEGAERQRLLDAHAKSIRTHMQSLSAKAYHSQFSEAPDYVIMFIPGEHFLAAALESDDKLWLDSFNSRVLLATPTNLVAIARTVAMVWSQDRLAREAIEIGRLGTEIYERIATAGEHLKGVGANLDRAVRKYNDFVGSYERNVVGSGRRLRDKGVEIGKREIEDVPLVESLPRYTAADADAALLLPDDTVDDAEAAE